MKVHLVRSKELSEETFDNVFNILTSYSGPIHFVTGEWEYDESELMTRELIDHEFFYKQHDIIGVDQSSPRPPDLEKYQKWDWFFGQLSRYRSTHNILDDEYIFYLSDIANDLNWFGSVADNLKDHFIHTAGWSLFFGEFIDDRFPIAYEVITFLLRDMMFDDRELMLANVHSEARGCANDFCQDKREVILKMRTADVCPDCLDVLANRDVSTLITRQLFNTLDGIRENLTFKGRARLLKRPSAIEVRGYLMDVYFKELGNLKLPLNPKEKAVYHLFLANPAGIELNRIDEYRDELRRLYGRFTDQSDLEGIESAVDRLVDRLDNNLNEVMARLRRKIKNAVGEHLFHHYNIEGPRNEPKKISLDREYITYVDTDSN